MVIEGIILAAGFSSRADTYKLTLKLRGKTIIERCIEGMYETCSNIIVVGGYNVEKLSPVTCKYPKIKLVFNERYQEGMFTSVKKGFKHAIGDKVFVTPGDCPFVTPDVYKSLLEKKGGIVIPSYKGKKGHPVLIDKSISNLLSSASNINSLRDFILIHGYTTKEVNCPGILMDIDTQEDYKLAKIYMEGLE